MDLTERTNSMRRFFNEHVGDYDEHHVPFLNSKRHMVDVLPEGVERVLDLGAGTGLELYHLFERFPHARVTAIDVSELMLERLQERAFAGQVECRRGDFFQTPLGEGYDAVISSSALHHFTADQKKQLYVRILHALKAGGILSICDYYSADDAEEAAHFAALEANEDEHRHVDTPLTVAHERSLLEEAGFHRIEFLQSDPSNHFIQIGYKPL